jgi:hypothetical protein
MLNLLRSGIVSSLKVISSKFERSKCKSQRVLNLDFEKRWAYIPLQPDLPAIARLGRRRARRYEIITKPAFALNGLWLEQ